MTESPSRYDYEFDPNDTSTAARVCRLVGHERRVLELGCAAGAMSAVLSRHYRCTVTGVEYDPVALVHARPFCDAVFQADLNDENWHESFTAQSFDSVLAADVLEHLQDPMRCLEQIRSLLGPNGELIVSVPNIAHGGVIAALLSNDFPYRDIGLLDRTHIHFFTSLTLGTMLHQAGFQVVHAETVDTGPEHPEFRAYWQNLPAGARQWLADQPAGRPYQIIMHARVAPEYSSYTDIVQLQALEWLGRHAVEPEGAARVHQADDAQMARDALEQAQNRAIQAESALEALKASRSWRVTAPLRWLTRKLTR